MRVATWNVNSVKQRLPRLLGWLDERGPDVVCVQETKLADDAFTALLGDELAGRDYAIAVHGEAQWNGVAILSRIGLEDVVAGIPGAPGFPHAEARALSATCGGIRMHCVYVPNGRSPDSEHYHYKLDWLRALREMVAAELNDTIVCGDMNIAPTDADVFDPAAYVGSTHVTPAERAALAELQALGLRDVVRDRWPSRAGVHLLGLPRRDVPPGSRHADRSRAGEHAGGRQGQGGMGGPAGPQGQGPERSRPRDRRPGRGAGRGYRAGHAPALRPGAAAWRALSRSRVRDLSQPVV